MMHPTIQTYDAAAGYEQFGDLLQQALNGTEEAIVLLDTSERIMSVNERFSKLFGICGEGQSAIMTIQHLFVQPQIMSRALLGLKRSEREEWAGEVAMHNAEGSVIAAQARFRPLYWHDEIAGFSGHFRDLTLQRRQDRKVSESRFWELLSGVAYATAHDVNNQLGIVMGYSDLARMTLSDSSPAKPMLGEIEPAARTAGDLCRRYMECLGRDGTKPTPVNLAKLAQEILPLLKVATKHHAVVEMEASPPMASIQGVPASLRQTVIAMTLMLTEILLSTKDTIRMSVGEMNMDEPDIGSVVGGVLKGNYGSVTLKAPGRSPEVLTDRGIAYLLQNRRPEATTLAACCRSLVRDQQGFLQVEYHAIEGWTVRACFPVGK